MNKIYSDVDCPYCGKGQEICHDDDYGYEEDLLHEQYCSDCDKAFVFTTSISFYYEAHKADCLNGEEHDLKRERRYFYPDFKRCKNCDYYEEGKAIDPKDSDGTADKTD